MLTVNLPPSLPPFLPSLLHMSGQRSRLGSRAKEGQPRLEREIYLCLRPVHVGLGAAQKNGAPAFEW